MTGRTRHLPLVSSSLASLWYANDTTLDLQPRSGAYRYFDVPPAIVAGLIAAASKGRYLRHIRPHFRYERVV